MKIDKNLFGFHKNKVIKEYTLENGNNLSLKILTLGATIREVLFKGKNKVLGFENVEDYINSGFHFGALVGRVAGRISNGKFLIEGKTYKLDQNEGTTCLHGGKEGFSFKVWELDSSNISDKSASITLKYTSLDSEGGFPGKLNVYVKYTIFKNDIFQIEYYASSSEKTPITLTNHSYFNLNDDLSKDILNHYLRIDSDKYIKLDKNNIPIEINNVKETPFDFRLGKPINSDMDLNLEELEINEGYDHPFILNNGSTDQIELYSQISGVKLKVSTTEPVVIVYGSNKLSGGYWITEGIETFKYQGICLETQWYPDALNQDFLPNNILEPGKEYYSKTKYEFI